MAVKSARDLLLHELEDMYYAENRIAKSMQEMAAETKVPGLKKAYLDEKKNGQGQIRRLEKVFRILDRPVKGIRCDGIDGLAKEKKSFSKQRPARDMRDIFNLGSAIKAERYEISAYESMAMIAENLGLYDAHSLLSESLREEQEALEKLRGLSMDLGSRAIAEE